MYPRLSSFGKLGTLVVGMLFGQSNQLLPNRQGETFDIDARVLAGISEMIEKVAFGTIVGTSLWTG